MSNQLKSNNEENILKELEWRGLLKQCTNEGKIKKVQLEQKHGVYCGFDPTGDSLHVGHLIQTMLLLRFQKFNFLPIAVIGGGTGMIGDPSGKKNERVLLSKNSINENVIKITSQIKKLIPEVIIANNSEWLSELTLLDFLRDIAKNFNISYLINKESIATRIQTGLSLTEFIYTAIQAYDFFYLYQNYNCSVQVGGSDQWGNITSGIELISKTIGDNNLACGVTMNLLTKSDGSKFGKTESGAIWLDENKTSVYEFYQFFLNQDDYQAMNLLKFLTFFSQKETEDIIEKHQNNSKDKLCQQIVAEEVTKFVHGVKKFNQAKKISLMLFNNELQQLSIDDFEMLTKSIEYIEGLILPMSIIDILINFNIVSSKRIARELINQKAININGKIIEDCDLLINNDFLLHKQYLLVKKGKRNYFLLSAKKIV